MAVTKTAPRGKVRDRLITQAQWLVEHDDPGIVKVFKINDDGYEMELLGARYDRGRPQEILPILERAVWSRPTDTVFDPDICHTYLTGLSHGEQLFDWLMEFAGRAQLGRRCDTHGDPTYENVLFRAPNYTPVLVDPLPDTTASGRLPSVRELDIGKLLQSAMGYEKIKAGTLSSWVWPASDIKTITDYANAVGSMQLSCCFAAIHIARLIPYQEYKRRVMWVRWLPDIIDHLKSV